MNRRPPKEKPYIKTTHELSETLNATHSRSALDNYISNLSHHSAWSGFSDYFNTLPAVKEIPQTELISRSGIDRTYGYQILNGTKKNPGKDKILRFALAAGITLEETQRALEIAGVPVLYSRNRRDAVIIFSLNRHLNVIDTNVLLDYFNEECLK